jgi:hypothetical protein
MQNLKLILFGQSITAIIYATVYLLKSFIIWKFTNPFLWIINLGYYSSEDRFFLLICFLFYYAILSIIIIENRKQIINFLTKK